MNERLLRQYGEQVADHVLNIVEISTSVDYSVTLKPYEQVVRIVTLADGQDITVTLPSVTEARGRMYSVHLLTRGDDEVVTLADQDDSLDWGGDYTIDAASDSILLYSDGFRWFVLDNEIS